jgi:hypothetical protein
MPWYLKGLTNVSPHPAATHAKNTYDFVMDPDVALMNKSLKILKGAHRRIDAYKNGYGFWKGLHMSEEDIMELASFSEFFNGYVLNSVIDKYEKDPQSITPAEDIAVTAKYLSDEVLQRVDPGSWYNIGATTKASVEFMRDYILTAGVGTAATQAVKAGISKITPVSSKAPPL